MGTSAMRASSAKKETEKEAALATVARGSPVIRLEKSKFRVRDSVIHVRFCSQNARAPGKYKFNINPNTLSANYELWICGNAKNYYLMPVALMRDIYDNPGTYVDNKHPGIRVVSVDIVADFATFAAGAVGVSLKSYRGGAVN